MRIEEREISFTIYSGINSKDIDLLNNVTSQDVLQAKMPYLIDIR